MKKLATLLLAASMVLGSFAGAQAIDFKVKGSFQMDFGFTNGLKFVDKDRTRNKVYGSGNNSDNFEAGSRIRFQLDAVASESLSGTVFFEIGQFQWGKNGTSGALNKSYGAYGTRSLGAGVRYAYLDWFVPQTDLKLRMGIQHIGLPSYTFLYSPVANYEGPGVTASYKFNDNASATLFWARPLNDNAVADTSRTSFRDIQAQGEMDNIDVFGLLVPLSFDGFKVTPYGLIGMIGPRSLKDNSVDGRRWAWDASLVPPAFGPFPANTNTANFGGGGKTSSLMLPAFWQTNNRRGGLGETTYGTAWWVGLTGEITAADPFRFAWEATYGSVTHPSHSYLDRQGWFINILAEYKLDWGVPGIYGWWASGDNGNPRDGSERMPMLAQNTGDYPLSTFGFSGGLANGPYDGIQFGDNPTGTWGVGVRIRDMSFLEGLKHTLRVNLMGGTNSPRMAQYMLGKRTIRGTAPATGGATTDFYTNTSGAGALYLTRLDQLVEVNFDSIYKIYENLEMWVELGYMHLWLDQSRSVWGSGVNATTGRAIRGVDKTDAVKASVTFYYTF